jgi:hypothetical protein
MKMKRRRRRRRRKKKRGGGGVSMTDLSSTNGQIHPAVYGHFK